MQYQRTEKLILLNPIEAAVGTGIAVAVSAAFVYVQSIWKKAVQSDVDKIIDKARTDAAAAVASAKSEASAGIVTIRQELKERDEAVNRRISLWEQRASQFVTREAMAEFEKKMDRMESRIEASINKITDRLDKLLEGRERH